MAQISLLFLTAAAASAAVVGNAVGLAASAEQAPPPSSRLGTAIADDMQQRDKAAGRRGRALELREQAVRAAEVRLGKDAAAPPPAGSPAAGGALPPDQFDDLARIYQAMKPAAAALVLEQLELEVQMHVAQKMRDRSTALILAAMTPKGAAVLTMALARRRTTPIAAAPMRLR